MIYWTKLLKSIRGLRNGGDKRMMASPKLAQALTVGYIENRAYVPCWRPERPSKSDFISRHIMVMVISAVRTPSGVALRRQNLLIDKEGGTIGRGRNNDWILPDPERLVSAQHCVIQFDNGRYYLTDLSTNGTFINEASRPLGRGETIPLRDGDFINLGDYAFQVSVRPAPAPPNDRRRDMMSAYEEFERPAEPRLPTVRAHSMSVEKDVREHSSAGRLRRKLARDMGIEDKHLSQEALANAVEQHAALCQLMVDGMMRLLRARASIKNGLRLEMTRFGAEQNNPLKFSADSGEAIEKLFVNPRSGDLPPQHAVAQAFDSISDHQAALIAAVKAGFRQSMELLDPRKFERGAAEGRGSLLGPNKAKLWDAYCERYESLLEDRQKAFQELFGEAFIEAYDSQTQRLQAERLRRSSGAKPRPKDGF